MKKNILAFAVAAMCIFGFTSCEDLADLDLVGHINLTATNPTGGDQAYADSTTLNFTSAMCNINVDSIVIDTMAAEVNVGTVMVGTTQTLLSDDIANLSFPLCGINLRDTVPATYSISCPINDFSFFEYLDTTNINSLITTGLAIGDNIGNLFAVAVSEDAYYIGYSGSITLTSFGRNMMSRVVGSVNDVEAIYVTGSQIEALANMSATERAAIDLTTYFPHITFNGSISSIRAEIEAVIDALNENAK